MRIGKLTAGALALALTATPVLAQTAPVARTSAPVTEESEMGGGSTLLYILAAIALGVGIFLIVDDGNSDSP